MLMVIFGAGASYDSVSDFPPPARGSIQALNDLDYRPPLAIDLFEKRKFFDPWVEEYHECSPVVPRLRQLPEGSNFEAELERLQAEGTNDLRRHVQLHAIRYYLRRIIWNCGQQVINSYQGITNYASLLDRIRNWQVQRPGELVHFLTFNYDTLLEHACGTALGIEFPSVPSYVNRVDHRVYKPHGSVNWVRQVDPNFASVDDTDPEHSIIRLGESLRLREDAYHISPSVEDARSEGEGRYPYPAIALPVEKKSVFECPAKHLDLLREDMPKVTRLLIVGWRGTEAHFLKLWKENRVEAISKIAIVAGGSGEAEQVRRNLKPSGLVGDFLLSDTGFSALMTGSMLNEFLAD